MRLFIGILFPEEVLNEIMKISHRLKVASTRGNFTFKENLHLTLAFLGEIEPYRLKELEACMNEIEWEPFPIELKEIGQFSKKDGDIYWIGVRESQELINLQSSLVKCLQREGFSIENRPYKPHLTIGRRIRIQKDFSTEELSQKLPLIRFEVDSINLMHSHRIEGRLTYTSLKEKRI